MATQKRTETPKAEPPPLYEVKELSLEEVMLLFAAEREEPMLRELERDRKPGRRLRSPPNDVVLSQQLLGDEQVGQRAYQDGDRGELHNDADAGQVVTDLAEPTQLAFFHHLRPDCCRSVPDWG